MRITGVQAFLMSYPMPKPVRLLFYGGERTILKRDAMLIRIQTDKGLTGYAPGPASEAAQAAIENIIAPFLEGREAGNPDVLRDQVLEGPGKDKAVAKTYGAVEIAVHDLAAQAEGVTVSEMLGGRVRDRIRLYGSAGMYMSPEEYAREAAAIAGLGFPAYKMRAGIGPEADLETVRLMRGATGPDIELMVDAHTWWRMGDRSYGFATVANLARAMAEHDIAWLEEPLDPEDHPAYVRMKTEARVPLASGEHETSDLRFIDLIDSGGVDYVQMDLCCQGGYGSGRRIIREVAQQGLKFAFHSWGTALEVIAAAQLGASWPEDVIEWLEYPCYSNGKPGMYPFPLASEILNEPLNIERGELVLPDKPGLGVSVDESVIGRYPWIPGPWSFFRLDSPAMTLAVTSDHSIPWQNKPAG